MINIVPKQPGPKFARVEFHPESYSYNHWGMRFGAATERNEDNSYFATGIWHSAESIEASGESLFLRVQRITNDTINANSDSNTIFNAELSNNFSPFQARKSTRKNLLSKLRLRPTDLHVI